jgi:hypothetical protein
MTETASARIAEMTAQNRHAVDLARLLSLAVSIEPALMRAMRIELLPHADVGAEADLWFGPLVATRSRDGIMLLPDVAEALRGGLSGKLAEQCWSITERLHDYLPPAVQLEEKLNRLSIDPVGNAQAISVLLQSALAALIGRARHEVANWAGRALPRLPQAVRQTEGAAMLAAASDLRLGRSWTLTEHLGGGTIPDWFAAVLPDGLDTAELGVSATALGLTLDPVPAEGAQRITVPATDPRVVQVSAQGKTQIVFVDATATQSVALSLDDGPIELATIAGEAFTLERTSDSAERLPGGAIACTAYANCNQALIAWQTAEPIEGCLGFALERIDAEGEAEFIKSLRGFASASGDTGALKPSTVWPIQRFNWMDRPPRSGRYAYRITPVAGTPDKTRLINELEARTSPVEVAVSRQGAITALFNAERSAAPQQRRGGRRDATGREILGGEIRRALLRILSDAVADQVSTVYAALFMLDDPDLVEMLARLGSRAFIVLSRDPKFGYFRKALDRAELHVRANAKLTHTNFMVVCEGRERRPTTVWTGSLNWTSGSLYGQDSNVLILEDRAIAARYLDQWHRLRKDISITPMAAANAKPAVFALPDGVRARLWFAPVRDGVDLADVARCVAAARSAVLFAIGPLARKSVLDDVLRRSGRLYVAGVARSSETGKQVVVYQHGTETLATPDRLPSDAFDTAGVKMNVVGLPIGSRLIVIDPFGDRPVVITGSHTFSENASRTTDNDLLIIEGNRALATQCAVHIQGLIAHYALRATARALKAPSRAALMLHSDDAWQERFMQGEREREIRFWMGTLGTARASPQPARASDAAPRSAKPPGAPRPERAGKGPRKAAKKASAKSRRKPVKKKKKK